MTDAGETIYRRVRPLFIALHDTRSEALARSSSVSGTLRIFTRAAVEAGSLRRVLIDHACEPLSVHALLPARQFVPAKVRCFLDALEAHSHDAAADETEPLPG